MVLGLFLETSLWLLNKLKALARLPKTLVPKAFCFSRDVFLPARRYASAGNSDRNVSVRPSVCPSVCHALVLCQNEES